MKSTSIAPLLLVGTCGIVYLSSISDADTPAKPAKNELQIREELSQAASKADKELDHYLKTVRASLKGDNKTLAALNRSQKTWLQFRQDDCNAVLQYWSGGTIRHAKSSLRYIQLTKQRTHALWHTYLTFADSTPPRLPRPKPMKDYSW